jgi:putative phosphoribosyl transferase
MVEPEINVKNGSHTHRDRKTDPRNKEKNTTLYCRRNMDYFLKKNTMDHKSIVILVDDGVASGATFIVAARWLRKFCNPERIIAAATVAPKETVKILKDEVDGVEVIIKPPSSSFHYLGQY